MVDTLDFLTMSKVNSKIIPSFEQSIVIEKALYCIDMTSFSKKVTVDISTEKKRRELMSLEDVSDVLEDLTELRFINVCCPSIYRKVRVDKKDYRSLSLDKSSLKPPEAARSQEKHLVCYS